MKEKANRSNLKLLMKEFRSDKVKNSNVIIDILKQLESDHPSSVNAAVTALHRVFTQLLVEGDIKVPRKLPDDLKTPQDKFDTWLYERFSETRVKLLNLLHHEARPVQELALCCLIKLMQSEGCHPLIPVTDGNYHFPKRRLKPLLKALVSNVKDQRHLVGLLHEYMECQDFMFNSLLIIADIVSNHKRKKVTEVYMNNLFSFLENITLPDYTISRLVNPTLFLTSSSDGVSPEEDKPQFKIPLGTAKKHVNAIWMEVINYPLTVNLYKRSLVIIPDKVLDHLEKPLRLTDFFMESYNIGGAISLLAMQGVFMLVQKYNLDYPDFYKKVYALLDPIVFHAKYRPRFFMLLDRFLASSHLPEYLVAAFIKRLARLLLVAPTSCLVLVLKFIANLLIRYPSLKTLIDNPGVADMESDPYDAYEPDPAKSKAGQSSLWEVAALQHHVLPFVSRAAGFLEKKLPHMEYDIGILVEDKYEDIYEKASKVQVKEVATTFHRPVGLFNYKADKMSRVWSVV